MVRLYPDYGGSYGEDIPSGEIKFYDACASLKGDYHVFHSVGWITVTLEQAAQAFQHVCIGVTAVTFADDPLCRVEHLRVHNGLKH